MPYRFDTAKMASALSTGIDRGLRAIMVTLGLEVKQMLSKPGHGRVYVRKSAGAKSSYLGFNKGALKKALGAESLRRLVVGKRSKDGQSSILQGRFASISRADAAAIIRQNRMDGKRNRSLRSMGFHKASAPGEPPAVDTGNLRRSWQTGFGAARSAPVLATPGRRTLRVGSSAKYARRLEVGSGALKPRPYLAPSVKIVQPRAYAIMHQYVMAAVARINK